MRDTNILPPQTSAEDECHDTHSRTKVHDISDSSSVGLQNSRELLGRHELADRSRARVHDKLGIGTWNILSNLFAYNVAEYGLYRSQTCSTAEILCKNKTVAIAIGVCGAGIRLSMAIKH